MIGSENLKFLTLGFMLRFLLESFQLFFRKLTQGNSECTSWPNMAWKSHSKFLEEVSFQTNLRIQNQGTVVRQAIKNGRLVRNGAWRLSGFSKWLV